MNETNDKNSTWTIVGLIALILVLFVSIKLIFAGLDAMLPDAPPSAFTMLTDKRGETGPYGLRMLTEDERQEKDIVKWMGESEDALDQGTADEGDDVFWLYRQDSDEYILYLPGQERTLAPKDLTVEEELDEDGDITLALRARTSEKSEEIVPEEQLFCFQTNSKEWNGIRVKIVVDGRERTIHKLVSKDGKLYSTEEVYIGRDR